jgi:hypothetical protein
MCFYRSVSQISPLMMTRGSSGEYGKDAGMRVFHPEVNHS